jgi:hypothetical protein
MGHRSHRNEWRTVSGPHALVFLEANQPRQSLVDPGINHGFEPDYGFETGRRARRRPAPEGSQGRAREAQDELGCGENTGVARPSGAPAGSICAALREAPQARNRTVRRRRSSRLHHRQQLARRHMSKGQQAMAVAMMHPEPAKTGVP